MIVGSERAAGYISGLPALRARPSAARETCERLARYARLVVARTASGSQLNREKLPYPTSTIFRCFLLISRDKRVQPRDRCRCTRTLLPRRNIPAASSSQAFRPARRSKNSQTHVQMPHAISKICVLDIRDGNRRVEVKCQTNRQTGSETEKRDAMQRYLRCTVVLISNWREPNQR